MSSLVEFLSDPFGFIGFYFNDIFSDRLFWSGVWQSTRYSFLVLDGILLIAFVGVYFAALKYRPKLRLTRGPVKRIYTLRDTVLRDRWNGILRRTAAATPDALKVAIIEADKFADDVLKQLGLGGEHMADRLEKLSPQEIRSVDRLWRAHRFRNNLVHAPDFSPPVSEYKKTLEDYQAFFKEVKVIE